MASFELRNCESLLEGQSGLVAYNIIMRVGCGETNVREFQSVLRVIIPSILPSLTGYLKDKYIISVFRFLFVPRTLHLVNRHQMPAEFRQLKPLAPGYNYKKIIKLPCARPSILLRPSDQS